jgi:hypothetical protein
MMDDENKYLFGRIEEENCETGRALGKILSKEQLEEIRKASEKYDGLPHGVVKQLLGHIKESQKMGFTTITIDEKEYTSFLNVITKQRRYLAERTQGRNTGDAIVVSENVQFHWRALQHFHPDFSWRISNPHELLGMPAYIDYFSKDETTVVAKME